jgi:hypothetical protein
VRRVARTPPVSNQRAKAVVPCVRDKDGKWQYLLTPAGFSIRMTLRDSLEMYVEYRENGVDADKRPAFDTLQRTVDGLLRDVLNGKDASKVFRLEPKKTRGSRKDIRREQAMCQAVLRLVYLHGVDEPTAKNDVAEAFEAKIGGEINIRTVERALKTWRNDPGFSRAAIANYERSLKLRNFLI